MARHRRRCRRRLLRHCAAFAAALSVLGLAGSVRAVTAPAAELVIIDSVSVGSPVFSTYSSCTGWLHHGAPVVPVTVGASFLVPNGGKPVGPYATGTWTGGYGSSDDHYGTAQGHAPHQYFHMLLPASAGAGYHGAGHYTVTALVQDVGLAGGIATRDAEVTLPVPAPTTATVKCDMANPIKPGQVLAGLAMSALQTYGGIVCPLCKQAQSILSIAQAYSDVLNRYMNDVVDKDPPDHDYQHLAASSPPPALPAPAGSTTAQSSALLAFEHRAATAIGELRALYTTVDRVWGADDAGSRYWHDRQLAAAARLADQIATSLRALPARWNALRAALEPELAQPFSVTEDAGLALLTSLEGGLPPDIAAAADALGEGPEVQQQMATELGTVDPADLVAADGVGALFGQNDTDLAAAMTKFATWARSTADADPPVVTGVSPNSIPSSGGSVVTVTGANLGSVTGIDFGPSAPGSGQGDIISCTDNQCEAYAPPGTGTVDVVAVGPAGPSDVTPGDRLSYVSPTTPHVSSVFPASGPTGGNTQVTVFGSGLDDGMVYFGPTAAQSWSCGDTSCTAVAPASASAGAVDVTVVNPAGTSATSAADRYTFVSGTPPPPDAPAVTHVSPASGSDIGGNTVTVTGSHLTGATSVRFGGGNADWRSIVVQTDSKLTVTAPPGSAGPVDVQVVTAGGSSAIGSADTYTYTHRAPRVTGVSPATGPDIGGTAVTITGTNLNNGSVYFGDTYTSDSVCSATRCTVTAPPHADGTVHVSVDTYDGDSAEVSADRFTYAAGPAPVITSLSPDTGPSDGGTEVVVTGTNLASGQVTVGGAVADGVTYPACSMTACVVTTPPHAAGHATVRVTTNAGASAAGAAATFSYTNLPQPVVTSISPSTGWLFGGQSVQITGTDLVGGTVYFGTVQSWSSQCTKSACTAQSPSATDPGTVDVTVRTSGGTSATGAADRFSYIEPTVTRVSPRSGWTAGGTQVTITGTNLAGGTVQFGTGDGSIADGTCTDTVCTVTAPYRSSAGVVDVRVQSPGVTLSPITTADRFTYRVRPAPTVTGVTPSSGTHDGGDTVTITGTNLDGATVKFGTMPTHDPCGTDSRTTCTVTTPPGPDGPVDVVVTTPAGSSATSGADTFTYVAPALPTVTRVSPRSGSTDGGTTVTVTGRNLLNGRVSFGGAGATSTTCTATSCTAVTPREPAGSVDVRVGTSAGTSAVSAADAYAFQNPARPVITGVDPPSGPASGGATLTVTGSRLAGATLMFGTTPATGVQCTDTSCTATQPARAAGTVDVRATTDGGTSAVRAADRFRYERTSLTEHPVPGVAAATGGGQIARDRHGDMWFTMPNLAEVGRISRTGVITTYATPTAGSAPLGIAPGPDGRMWVAEQAVDKLDAIATDGTQTEYAVPGQPSDLRFVVAGPDRRLWFTLGASGSIGAMTTTGRVTIYHLPDPTVFPYQLLAGSDGRLWFTEVYGNSIGTITTTGQVQEYPIPDVDAEPWGITAGPDGRIWFAEEAQRSLGAISQSGAVQMYRLPPTETNPEGLVLGSDGRMWFAAPDVDQVSALDPGTGAVTDYPLPNGPGHEQPRYLAMDLTGALWVTEFGGPNVVKISGIASTAAPVVTDVGPDHGAAGTSVTITGTGLSKASSVHFGATAAPFSVTDPAHIQATVPAGSGTVTVQVTTGRGTSAASPGAQFSYGTPVTPPVVAGVSPPTGTTSGGTVVTITGTGLNGGSVTFGGVAATGVTCTATSCGATSPRGAAGTVDVRVTTAGGTSEVTTADRFTYLKPDPAQPRVTGLSPSSGPAAGGTTVRISGTALSGGTVTFGLDSVPATCTSTSCTVTTPAGAVGVVDVRVETAGGRSAITTADRFRYTAT